MIEFEKMHALGNDFVVIDLFDQTIGDYSEFARKYLDRHFGIGADQLLLLLPSEKADVKMRIFNPDGSEAGMCGNGIRCLVDFALRHGRATGKSVSVETLAGLKKVTKEGGNYRVNMGRPVFEASLLPSVFRGESFPVKITLPDEVLDAHLVSMGNPHAVIFEKGSLEKHGKVISENRSLFPNGINVEFVKIISSNAIEVHVWERGAGPTLACGTGACASAVASVREGRVGSPVTVKLPGGELVVEWDGIGDVVLVGPASSVFQGVLL